MVGLLAVLAQQPPPASAASRRSLQDPRLRPLQQFWAQLLAELQQQLSDDFAPALLFYSPAELLPTGTPGERVLIQAG